MKANIHYPKPNQTPLNVYHAYALKNQPQGFDLHKYFVTPSMMMIAKYDSPNFASIIISTPISDILIPNN